MKWLFPILFACTCYAQSTTVMIGDVPIAVNAEGKAMIGGKEIDMDHVDPIQPGDPLPPDDGRGIPPQCVRVCWTYKLGTPIPSGCTTCNPAWGVVCDS
jgi:hypothetical protein